MSRKRLSLSKISVPELYDLRRFGFKSPTRYALGLRRGGDRQDNKTSYWRLGDQHDQIVCQKRATAFWHGLADQSGSGHEIPTADTL